MMSIISKMKKTLTLLSVTAVCAANSHKQPYLTSIEYSYNQRPFLVDVPKTLEDAQFLQFVDKFHKQYVS